MTRVRPTGRLALVLLGGALPAALTGTSWIFAALAVALDVLVLLLVLASHVRGRAARAVLVRRLCPERVLRQRPMRVSIEVANPSPLPVTVDLDDRLPDSFEPREHRATLTVSPQGRARVDFEATPLRRGSFALSPPTATVAAPLGLSSSRVKTESSSAIAVMPDLSALTRFDALVRRRQLHEMGISRSRQRGDGTEIDGLRPYAVGDPYASLDWKATARRGQPVTRQMHAERRQNVLLLLDCGRRMAREIDGKSRLDQAIEAAILLGHVALRTDDRVGLIAFADDVLRAVPIGRGSAHSHALAQAVYSLEPVLREPPYGKMAAEITRRFPRRTLAVLFTDVIEPASLEALAAPVRFLSRTHLLLCVVFQDRFIASAVNEPLDRGDALFRVGAASELALERERGLASLRRAGALVLETPAEQLSSAVINRYLDVKARRLL